jgi:hypothetical protein
MPANRPRAVIPKFKSAFVGREFFIEQVQKGPAPGPIGPDQPISSQLSGLDVQMLQFASTG